MIYINPQYNTGNDFVYAPAKIVCAEQGFADGSVLWNAHYILHAKQIELKLVWYKETTVAYFATVR